MSQFTVSTLFCASLFTNYQVKLFDYKKFIINFAAQKDTKITYED